VSHLLDVNLLLASGWTVHDDHTEANRWLDSAGTFATCPATQMGFIRVSIGPGYGASFPDAVRVLRAITGMSNHRFIPDATTADSLPEVGSHRDVSGAHLVRLAAKNRLKLATLDDGLCLKPWARGVAENPIRPKAAEDP
jgi:predicted nucleic acid-binding protein